MKVRVPKDLRPPVHNGLVRSEGFHPGDYKITGKFRRPRWGEYFWASGRFVQLAEQDYTLFSRVILERVPSPLEPRRGAT